MRGIGHFGVGGWQVGWVVGGWVRVGVRVAGGLDGVSSLCLSLCCSKWPKELHGEKTASISVQYRFKISSKSV